MKAYILLLLLAALVQTSFWEVNLCLIILIAKSFASYQRENFFLALASGLILGLLTPVNIGFWPLIFLTAVWTTHLLRKLPVTQNILTIIPVSLFLIALVAFIEGLTFRQRINIPQIVFETALSLPVFVLIKIWEERFVVKNDIKLKLRDEEI